MNKLLAVFEKHLVPTMEKINRNIWVSTLKDAIMQTLPMTLLGSIFCVLTVPADLLGWSWFANFWTPWQWTMGLLAVFIAVLVPLNYLEKRKLPTPRKKFALVLNQPYHAVICVSAYRQWELSQRVF